MGPAGCCKFVFYPSYIHTYSPRGTPIWDPLPRNDLRLFALDGQHLASYYKGMSNTPDYTTDLPDNFDPSWDEPTEQQWEDWRDEAYADEPYCHDDYSYDAAVWESAYGPADDGGYPF